MNELYAADPSACIHSSDLRLLLNSFGPYTGRYLANYPNDWSTRVESAVSTMGEIEAARVRTLLRRARESTALITRANLAWSNEHAWLENALPKAETQPAIFTGLIATVAKPPTVYDLHDIDLPPTAEERVEGRGEEYARASKILLLLSPEVVLIDPYLNPLKRSYALILTALFQTLAKGKCQKISLWARASEVIGTRNESVICKDISVALRNFSTHANLSPGRDVEMVLVEDESKKDKMHGRYLLSIKGGIRFDQGFQQLADGRLADVGPVGKLVHDELLNVYFEGKHDMRIANRVAVTS
jgi:hypothetical protein